jgi:drug/metabolite transporter (DMT)-like permease
MSGSPARGIVCILAAMSLLSVNDALARDLAERLPLMAMIMVRSIPALVPVLLFVHYERAWAALRTRHLATQLARGGLIIASYALYLVALTGGLTFAMSISLVFTSPLFVAALSRLVLKENVTRARWLGTLIGFAGVLVALRPGLGSFQPVALCALGSGFCYACASLLARRLGAHEPASVTSFYTWLMFFAGSAPFALADWGGWSLSGSLDLGIVVVIGLIAGSSHALIVQAYRLAPAAMVAPFEYVAMLWGTLLGFLFWAEVPGVPEVAGIACIVAGGLVILQGDRRKAPAPA